MDQEKLFDIPAKAETVFTCRDCEHRERWECNSKVFQYCGVRKSGRTFNGLQKIKCKDKACSLFVPCSTKIICTNKEAGNE